jgi:hypothetical protein
MRLDDNSAIQVAEWFRRNGYPYYCQRAYEPRQDQLGQDARTACFKSFFSKWEQRRFFPDLTKCRSDDQVQDKCQECIQSLLSDSKDEVDLLSRIFMALGSMQAMRYGSTGLNEQIAEKVARRADENDYMQALNRVYFDDMTILAASDSFLWRNMPNRLSEPDRGIWTTRIARIRFTASYAAERIRMLDLVDSLHSPNVNTLLIEAATGIAERSPLYRPGFRNFLVTRHACELLAGRCEKVRAAQVAGMLSACRKNDRAELTRIAFSLALDPKIVNSDILTVLAEDEEASLQLTDLLTACRDVEVFQRIVDLMEEDERFVWLDTFFDAFEKATGHTFFIPDKGAYLGDWIRESANRQTVRDWWAANRDRLAAEWAAAPAK